MKIKNLLALVLLSLILIIAPALHADYRIDPWGSKIWTGSDRPPHWSPKPTQPDNSAAYKRSAYSNRKDRHGRGSAGKGGYWQDLHNRWYYHRNRQPGYIYHQKPTTETVIIKQERYNPVYSRIKPKPTKLQCGGNTISRNDPKSGERIIEYITAARDC